ncbi:MAG: TetR/AcrR family transcriptional regulator C-terminal domain-containing protein [Luteibacter sp.]
MAKKPALSRERIVDASIALLDRSGEAGLTFRQLSAELATGPGAIYWHVANKGELLLAACDAVLARTLDLTAGDATPEATLRAIALGMFDAIDAHPWVGSVLATSPGQMPAIRLLERVGQQVRALGVPDAAQWATVSALLSYIVGSGGQNAANARRAQAQGLVRSTFLDDVATAWSSLDADAFPFTRSVAGALRAHDDRADFLVGIDLILRGIEKGVRVN